MPPVKLGEKLPGVHSLDRAASHRLGASCDFLVPRTLDFSFYFRHTHARQPAPLSQNDNEKNASPARRHGNARTIHPISPLRPISPIGPTFSTLFWQ
jgi:hypothetical protein